MSSDDLVCKVGKSATLNVNEGGRVESPTAKVEVAISMLSRLACGGARAGVTIATPHGCRVCTAARAVPCRAASVLRSARVVLRKRLGQHLLTNPDVVANIVAHAGIAPGERVFEIGPGTGNLTAHLLASPAAVVFAVELDERLFAVLGARARGLPGGAKLQCVRGDFLRVPLPVFDVLVANIPYQISSPVLRRVFAHTPLPRRAVIMFQREFAERIVARPGSATYCRLSVNCQLLAACALVQRIGAAQFRPPPKVDSAVVTLDPRGWPPGLDFDDWDALLRVCFASKNKTLRSVLAGNKTVLATLALRRVMGADSCVGGGKGGDGGIESDGCGRGSGDGSGTDRGGPGDVVIHTAAGSVTRAVLDNTRACVLRVLSALSANEWRANAMPIDAFRAVYDALRAEGFRFAAPSNPSAPTAREERLVQEARVASAEVFDLG